MGQQSDSELTVTMASDLEVVMTRVFDAPRALVFEAHSKCEHLRKWWARGNPMDCEVDFRPGGRYRIVEHVADEGDFVFFGEYHEIVVPERIVQTFEYEGMPGKVIIDTITFEEHDGKTTLTTRSLFETVEDRDGMLTTGMETGYGQSLDKLAELLTTLA
ncbi:MAG TPA: SRPBCC family protein [Micromonosporaceae bacterium]|nr:SRPBCC family protein [Micromonosporaceae bacterium]